MGRHRLPSARFAATATSADRALRLWLIAVSLAVAMTVAIGGATRLTESGLSITEWQPVAGILPPLSEAGWQRAYEQYLEIPEAQTVHAGITLRQFKTLFWWEWAHRLAGRLVGVIVALPFLTYWRRGWIRPAVFPRLLALPLLVGAQGGLGWYMVRSGLSGRTSVSPYRLVAHLSLALIIFAVAVWTAASMGRMSHSRASRPAKRFLALLTAGIALVIVSGGFVAGLDAGRIFNEFPLMGGRIVPEGYGAMSGLRNFFENPIAVQFNHRVLATLGALAIWVAWWRSRRSWPVGVRRWLVVSALLVVVQVALGIWTLLLNVPVAIAVAHQLVAVALLAALLLAGVEARDARI
jgi:cytochrome c oxidase assembly protein subunit 15